ESARVGAHRERDRRAPGGVDPRPRDARRDARRPRPGSRRHPRETALDDGPARRGRRAMRHREAGWAFVAPALVLILVFFVVPVVASLLLSLTDFDIYAVAS